MKMRKALSAFLAVICLCSMLGICVLGVSAEDATPVYATTSSSVKQGSTYNTCYVYLDDLTDLSALTVSVHYDPEKVSVQSSYNKVACTMYDSSSKDGVLQFSYLFDGKGTAKKTQLFYFYYKVNDTAEVGDTYFDIVVSDALNQELAPLNIRGSRCAFTISEKTMSKSASISSTTTLSSSVKQEFTLSYRLSTYQIASGTFTVNYDPELFEVVEVTAGGFLSNKLTDINQRLDGALSVSFAGTEYGRKYDLITVKFKTLKNVKESSQIKLSVTDLYDLDLNLITCTGYTSTVDIAFDETYTEDAPSVLLSSAYDGASGKVILTVRLEEGARLGAGDFVLRFDSEVLRYLTSEKGFSPTFFTVNDKNVGSGILKFSILSLADITSEETLLTVTFDAVHLCWEQTTDLEITASGLTDALTNAIVLNFVDTSVTIPTKHTPEDAVEENRVEPTCTASGSYDSVVYCSVCDAELSRETLVIEKLGHTPEDAVEENRVEPTCTADGSYDSVVYCSVCDAELSREAVVIDKVAHDYTEEGDCSVCGAYRAVFSGASLTLEDSISVNFKVDPTQFFDTGYTPFVIFSFLGEEYEVTQYATDARGRYAFAFSDIAPRMMNDEITATLYLHDGDTVYPCQTKSYSVKEYCYNMLGRCEAGGEFAENENFKTLLVDLLLYGDAAQIYGDYETEHLVSRDLTDAQRAFATGDAPALETVFDSDYKTVQNPAVTWKAGGLLLEDAVTMRFKFATDSTEGLNVRFTTEDDPEGWIVGASELIETSGGYYVYFDGLKARQMRETVYVTVYRDGVAVSNTVSYSIESYAYAKRDDADEKLTALLIAMMKYGDSAERYING